METEDAVRNDFRPGVLGSAQEQVVQDRAREDDQRLAQMKPNRRATGRNKFGIA